MLNVFISYSHKDPELLGELRTHLDPLRRKSLIQMWSDQAILPGERWQEAIWENFRKSDLVLLLVSPDFLASNYCQDLEFRAALDRYKNGIGHIVPIIVRPCGWRMVDELSQLQAIPPEPAVTTHPNRDQAWTEVVEKIHRVVQKLSTAPALQARSEEEDFDGDAVVSLCNRQPQEMELWSKFLAQTGAPQIYFLPGSEDSLHKRFLDRVIHRTLPDMLGQSAESLRDLVKPVAAPWVERPPAGNELPFFRDRVTKAIDPALAPDAAKIAAHPKLAGRIFVLHHWLPARYWNAKMIELLRGYAEFWGNAKGERERPLFLIFFLLKYSEDQIGRADAIEEELAALCAELDGKPCTVAMLPRLGCIERDHVFNWMEQYTPRGRNRAGEDLLSRLFSQSHCVSMRQVESELRNFIG